MQCNIGKTDRAIRILAGAAILVAGIVEHSWLGLIGLVPLATALVKFCPAYAMLGLSTKKCCGSCGHKTDNTPAG
jgi:hypothetical protein